MTEPSGKPLALLALWDDPLARDGPEQMACDEALLGCADLPVMRVFRWWRPWASAGYFIDMNSTESIRPGLPTCRRWTGGGIVVHDGDFTFSLVVPRGEPLAQIRPAESYRRIHGALVSALREEGVSADLAQASVAAPGECFAAAVEHDILARGKKIAGGAQRRTRRGLLHQGSLQTPEPLGRQFGGILARAVSSSVVAWRPPPDFEGQVARLTAEKYASPGFLRGPEKRAAFTETAVS